MNGMSRRELWWELFKVYLSESNFERAADMADDTLKWLAENREEFKWLNS